MQDATQPTGDKPADNPEPRPPAGNGGATSEAGQQLPQMVAQQAERQREKIAVSPYGQGVNAANAGADRTPPFEQEPHRHDWLKGYDDQADRNQRFAEPQLEGQTVDVDPGAGDDQTVAQVYKPSEAEVIEGLNDLCQHLAGDPRYDLARQYIGEAVNVCPKPTPPTKPQG